MKRVIKEVDVYDKGLQSLSIWWEKISLIGKINSYEVASTILQDMEHTLGQFNTLQVRLIESLVNEHTRKIIVQNSSRSQMAIDVLIRNLFERTADIGFLSTDSDVIDLLKLNDVTTANKDFIKERLQAYINIYSVYQDAILLRPDGELVFQLSQPSRIGKIQESIIEQAINNPNEYVEFFGKTQLIEDSESHLLYANAVVENDVVIGVIVLCFKFNNELEGIINRLLLGDEKNHFMLLNSAGEIIFAPQYTLSEQSSRLRLNTSPEMVSFLRQNMIKICSKGQSYQDYSGPKNWHMSSLLPLSEINKYIPKNENKNDEILKDLSGLIPEELLDIRRQSISINDDLQLIVLNGIIAAARNDAVEFMPVLEAIKIIGQDIDNIFERSIDSLFLAIISGQLDRIRLQANLAVDIMDRNLFERANDCRWWGLSSLLRIALLNNDTNELQQTLSKINALYTVYHTIYVYDDKGCYIAFSNDKYNDKIGSKVEAASGAQAVFNLKTEYEYTVSNFESFECYQEEMTYIYNAALRDMNSFENIIGGIGIVFDSTAEFNAILTDILPRENGEIKIGSKALFTNDKGAVIATTSEDYVIGSTFLPTIDMEELEENGSLSTVIKLDGLNYLLGVAKSTGYREYKRDDGYENTIITWVLMPC